MLKNYKLSKSAVSQVPYTFNDRKSKSINEKVSKLKTAIVQNVCVCILRTQNMGRFGSFFRGDSIFVCVWKNHLMLCNFLIVLPVSDHKHGILLYR